MTQRMCDEAVDDFLAALKLVPDWFVTIKMIKKLYSAQYANDDLIFFDENSCDVTFCCDEMGILIVNLNDINLHNNLDEDDHDSIIVIRLLVWDSKLGQ